MVAGDIGSILRVAAIAVAAYDLLLTIPATYRIYTSQGRLPQIRSSYLALRYISFATVFISNYGWFSVMSVEACSRWWLLPPTFRVLQGMVAQFIIGHRAWTLSQRSRSIGWVLAFLYVSSCAIQWAASLYGRKMFIGPTGRNCGPAAAIPQIKPWIYYVVALIYDFVATAVSLRYLTLYKLSTKSSSIKTLVNILLRDGLVYFVLVSAANVLNIILYPLSPNIQSAGPVIGYVLTWIAAQRLLIHLHDARAEHQSDWSESHQTEDDTEKSVEAGDKSQESNPTAHEDVEGWTHPDLDDDTVESDVGERIGVQVRVERNGHAKDFSRSQDGFKTGRPLTGTLTSQGSFSVESRQITSGMRAIKNNPLMRTMR